MSMMISRATMVTGGRCHGPNCTRDEDGNPHVQYVLMPSEVTIVRDSENGTVVGYIWEPVGPVPQPAAPRRLPPSDKSWLEVEDT